MRRLLISSGIGGDAGSNAGDGYYDLALDLDGSGAFATERHFFRLLGDGNGDANARTFAIPYCVIWH